MTSVVLNAQGDKQKLSSPGFGADIASQRADDLDLMALAHINQELVHGPVMALDVACGEGGQAVRMAVAGASVLAIDIADMEAAVSARAMEHGVKVPFLRANMRYFPEILSDRYDVISCQRAIHYLHHGDAVRGVAGMAALLKPGGRLFISASGIDSELGQGYPGVGLILADRYFPLRRDMVEKHGIHGDVCLYDEDDMVKLLQAAGLKPVQVFSSPFGNIKAVAEHG